MQKLHIFISNKQAKGQGVLLFLILNLWPIVNASIAAALLHKHEKNCWWLTASLDGKQGSCMYYVCTWYHTLHNCLNHFFNNLCIVLGCPKQLARELHIVRQLCLDNYQELTVPWDLCISRLVCTRACPMTWKNMIFKIMFPKIHGTPVRPMTE